MPDASANIGQQRFVNGVDQVASFLRQPGRPVSGATDPIPELTVQVGGCAA